MAARSFSETKRIQYLLGLSSSAEREHIESEYFADDDAFQEMLMVEDDLLDAYARGELSREERRSFEQSFTSSLNERNRVQFARAFSSAVSANPPVSSKLPGPWLNVFKTFQSPALLRTATIAVVIVFVVALAWLVRDRRRMSNELRELRAESAQLNKRTDELQRTNDTELTRTGELVAQLAALRAQPDKPRHPGRGTTAVQQKEHLPSQDASLGKHFQIRRITVLPLEARNTPNLLTLQTAATREGYVAGSRADQTNETLDGVDIDAASPSTTIRGTAKDPQGNVVTGATVTLIDSAKNFIKTQSTNEDGAFVFSAIPPGIYSIEVKASNFKTAAVSGLAARIDTTTSTDVLLEVGAVTENFQVTSTSAKLIANRQDATLGSSFEAKRITELPLEARNVPNLLTLRSGQLLTSSLTRTVSSKSGPVDHAKITLHGLDGPVPSWIRFQITLETAAIHEDYRFNVKTVEGRSVTTLGGIEPLRPNDTVINTHPIRTADLSPGDYVLLLMGKEPDGSFVEVAEYSFKVIK